MRKLAQLSTYVASFAILGITFVFAGSPENQSRSLIAQLHERDTNIFERHSKAYERLQEKWEREDARKEMEREAERAERPFGRPDRYDHAPSEGRLPDRGEVIRDRQDHSPVWDNSKY